MNEMRCVVIVTCLLMAIMCKSHGESVYVDVKTICDSVNTRRYDMTLYDSVTLTYGDEMIDASPCKLEFYIPGNELYKKICSTPVNFAPLGRTVRLEYYDEFYAQSSPTRVYSKVQPQRKVWCGTKHTVFVVFSATTNSTGNIVLKLYATDNGLEEPSHDFARTLVFIVVGVVAAVVVIVVILVAVVCFCCYRRRRHSPGMVFNPDSPVTSPNGVAVEMVTRPNTTASNGHAGKPKPSMAPVEENSPVI